MFRWIIGTSLQFRVLVLGVAAAIVAFGFYRLQKMPVDVFPEFAAPTVEVQTEALGLSAKEVESLITLNLEELLSGVPWLKSIRSKSVTGLSSIVLTFEPGTDIVRARQMMQERLTLAYTLPNVAHPPVILQPVSATSRFMMIGLSSKKVETTELSLIARWTIKPKLVGVPGVANVAIWGQRLRQMHVQINPDRLRDARLMQDDVIATAGDSLWVSPLTFLKGSAPGTGGWIDNRNQRIGVHHNMPLNSPEDMAKVAVGAQHLLMTGKAMSLGEVTETTFSHPPLIGDAYVNGGNGLLLVIEKFPGANTLEVTDGIRAKLSKLTEIPANTSVKFIYDQSLYIRQAIANLQKEGLLGAGLAGLMIFLFLRSIKAALVVGLAIPLSLTAALVALYLSGQSVNIMTLGGLALVIGTLLDNNIVVQENLHRHLLMGKSGRAAAEDSAIELTLPILVATICILIVYLPIVFFSGIIKYLFVPLAMTVSLVAGAISGLLGIGGGVIQVPVLNSFCGIPIKVAAATSTFMIGVTAAASAFIYWNRGDVSLSLTAAVALGAFPGSALGARLAAHIHARYLKLFMAIVLLAVGAQMAFEAL